MHNLGYTKSVHLDLAPYLLAQKLFLDNKGEFYLSERILDIKDVKVDFLINQDSFPEISYKELKKIFDFIEKNKINKIFSNNHCSDNQNQSDFRLLLKERSYRPVISFPNPIRKGYLIEYYIKN